MIFNDKDYTNIFSLAKEMYLNYDYFAKELRQEKLLCFIKENDEKKYERIQRLSLLSLPDDIFVFKASYILNPFMSLRIKGFIFKDYVELGKTMLSFAPNPNPMLVSLVRYALISEHMKTTYFAKDNKEDYEKILTMEKLSETDFLYAYYEIAYYLCKSTTIIYKGVEYKNIFNLTYFLCKSEDLYTLGAAMARSPLLKVYSKYCEDSVELDNYLHLCKSIDKSEKELDDFLEKKKLIQ